MRFTCCLNMAFTWKSLNLALICMHDVTLECVAAITDHSPMFFFVKTLHAYLWRCCDVMTFEIWRWRHFVLYWRCCTHAQVRRLLNLHGQLQSWARCLDFGLEFFFFTVLWVCEQWRLWRCCAQANARLSICFSITFRIMATCRHEIRIW